MNNSFFFFFAYQVVKDKSGEGTMNLHSDFTFSGGKIDESFQENNL